MMRKRAQHEVLHIVLTILNSGEKVMFGFRRRSFQGQRQKKSQTLLASPFACDGWHTLAHSKAVASAPDGLFRWIAQRSNLT